MMISRVGLSITKIKIFQIRSLIIIQKVNREKQPIRQANQDKRQRRRISLSNLSQQMSHSLKPRQPIRRLQLQLRMPQLKIVSFRSRSQMIRLRRRVINRTKPSSIQTRNNLMLTVQLIVRMRKYGSISSIKNSRSRQQSNSSPMAFKRTRL